MEWISVEDRLPELLKTVLVINTEAGETMSFDDKRQFGMLYKTAFAGNKWMVEDRCGFKGQEIKKLEAISHWLEIPKAI